LDRPAINAEREAERQHEDSDLLRPTTGNFCAMVQRHLQARDALLQDFVFMVSAKSESRQERHGDGPGRDSWMNPELTGMVALF
jgi:hypothetical protein